LPESPSRLGVQRRSQLMSDAWKSAFTSWNRVSARLRPYLQSGPIWGKWDVGQIPSSTSVAVGMLKNLAPIGRTIDLGCGTGKGLNALASLGAESLVGLDVNIRAATYAQSLWRCEQPAAFIAGDATQLPFAGNTFDLAVAQAFLTVVPTRAERNAVIEEVCRVLRPGGHFYVGDFLQDSKSNLYRERYVLGETLLGEYGTFPVEGPGGRIAYLAHHFAQDELQDLLINEGFDVRSVERQSVKTRSGRAITGISVVAKLKE
jgi:ubiquinone/menaquinone biosynthesis C-methylase UbiE